MTKKTIWITLACLAVTALCIAALATDFFGARREADDAGEGLKAESVASAAALQTEGYAGSGVATAAAAWQSYCALYDPDGTLRAAAAESAQPLDERCALYSAYTPEMCEKLNAIAGENALTLYESMTFCYTAEDTGCAGLLPEGSEAVGYLYNDGSFHLDVTGRLNETPVFYQLDRYGKGALSESAPDVERLSALEGWYFTTAGGERLLLMMGAERGYALSARADSFAILTVNEPAVLSSAALEALCDGVDWAKLD